MNTNSNTYTVLYATVLVIVVATVLAFVSLSLSDRQQENVLNETKENLLVSVNLPADSKQFNKYITDAFVLNDKGEKIDNGIDAALKVVLKEQFDIVRLGKDKSALKLPVFVCTLDNGSKVEILSAYGAGLWGPIWGFVSIESDYNTIYGAYFGHKGETPGLGAEIASDWFQKQFAGKKIYNNEGQLSSVTIKKGGATPGSMNEVDAISGGTITSRSLENAIRIWMELYRPYIEMQK